jgi:hypothetical protein
MFTVYKFKVIGNSKKQYARSRKVRARVKRKLKKMMNPIKPPKPIQYHLDSAKIPRLFKNVVPIRSPLTIWKNKDIHINSLFFLHLFQSLGRRYT